MPISWKDMGGTIHREIDRSRLIPRTLLMILGLFVTTLGIAISAISGLGTTPQATLPYVLSLGLPMTLGFWTLVINTVFIIIQWLLLGHRITAMLALQIPVMILFSVFNDVSMALLDWLVPINYLESWMLLIVSVILLSVGTAMTVKADVSFGLTDGIVRVIAWMRRSEFGSIKLCFDILMVTLAVESSLIMFHGLDGVREGTVVAMLLIGPLVRMLTRWMHAEPEIRNDSNQGSTGS